MKNSIVSKWMPFVVVIALWVVYALATFALPASETVIKYGLTDTNLALLRTSVAIPVLAIWLILASALVSLRHYVYHLSGDSDSDGFWLILVGIGVFLAQSIFNSFFGILRQWLLSMESPSIAGIPLSEQALRLFQTYIGIAFSLTALAFLYFGTKRLFSLIRHTKAQHERLRSALLPLFLLVAISASLYAWMFDYDPFRSATENLAVLPEYGIPFSLIYPTIILPNVLAWTLGILAVVQMSAFGTFVSGTLYRAALKDFARGFVTIVILTIILGIITQLTAFWDNAPVGTVVSFVYAILAVILYGYALLARGSRKLVRIEEAALR